MPTGRARAPLTHDAFRQRQKSVELDGLSYKPLRVAFNPFVSAWRYLPAPAFIPLLLMWFGAGEGSKLALLFIGVIFFLITLIIDHTRARRRSRYFRKRHCRRASEGEARSRRGGDRLLAAAELCRPVGPGCSPRMARR